MIENAILCIIENMIIIKIIDSTMVSKYHILSYLIVIILSGYALSINTYQYPFALIIAYCILLLYTICNYEDSMKRKFIVSLSVFALNAFLAIGIILLLGFIDSDIDVMLNNDLFYYSIFVIQKFLLVVIFIPFNKIKIINWKLLLFELIIFFISNLYIFYCYLQKDMELKITLMILSFMTIDATLTIYISYKHYSTLMQHQSIMLKEQYTNNINANVDWYNTCNLWLHDIRNKSIALRNALQDGESSLALEILDMLSNDKIPFKAISTNPILNYIINNKSSINNIKLDIVIEDELFFLNQNDLMLLMDNLLNYGVGIANDIKLQILKTDFGIKIIMSFHKIDKPNKIQNKFLLENTVDIINQYKGSISIEENCIKICFFNKEDNHG